MPKRDSEDHIVSELGNWNVADQYTKSKIMKPLILCDYYEDMATFGYDAIEDQLLAFNTVPNDYIKITALVRLIKELIRLCDNTKFAMRRGNSKETLLKYKKNLEDLNILVPKLYTVTCNQINHSKTTKIKNPVLFDKFLRQISLIKSKINEPLNQNDLIFTDKEEFDPKKFKQRIKKRMTEQG